jgi:hypothetical protein
VHLTSGESHVRGLRTDRTARYWGENEYGVVDAPSGPFLQIDAGSYSTCDLRSNGRVVCWGNWYGNQLIQAPTGMFTQISQAWERGCGVLTSGIGHHRLTTVKQRKWLSASTARSTHPLRLPNSRLSKEA